MPKRTLETQPFLTRVLSIGAVVAITMLSAAACGSSPTAPTPPTPATSSLRYEVPAASAHAAAAGDYTTANAAFRGSVRTTCVPNPNIAGSVCPDLMVVVQPVGDTFCQLWVFAPVGETLAIRSYPMVQQGNRPGIAGMSFNCARGGTTCHWSVGNFTIHELQAAANGTVTRLYMTFEQTCAQPDTLSTAGFGKLVGELWIVNGTTPI